MVVALRAGHRQTQPGGACCIDAIEEVVEPLLLGDRAPLAVEEMVAIEAGGDFLLHGRVGKQVAGQLLDRELVKRHVGIERLHHPIPPDPLPRVAILLESVGVGIPCGIEPREGHPLAVVRTRQESVDEPFVGLRIGIGHEGVDFSRERREPDEVDGEPTDQRRPVGLGRRVQARALEFLEHESIDLGSQPCRLLHERRRGPRRRYKGPVRLVGRPLPNPAVEESPLVVGQPAIGLRRRHDHVGVGRVNPLEERARPNLAGHNRPCRNGCLPHIQPQVRLPLVAILTVAIKAVLRQDRPDIAVELERFRRRSRSAGHGRDTHGQRREPADPPPRS